jgi:hypothetical protein
MEIQPEKQNLDSTFANTVYHIDFYQRDYKWTEEPVRRLLDDVFYQFEETYAKHGDLDPSAEGVNDKYPWYYLNTYVTNTVGGRVFVVDGQQRLTTLTLILIKLHGMTKSSGSELHKWLERKICGYSGVKEEFWMNHAKSQNLLKELLHGAVPAKPDEGAGITGKNILLNFAVIQQELGRRLDSDHKLETFVYYFLHRLVLINLSVATKHVPMVFEVINDRGVRLKPYEILKGKLLGQIDKLELDQGQYNQIWDQQINGLLSFHSDEADAFFRFWLKAKHSDTRKAGQRFDGDYHREMFKADLNEALQLEHNPSKVKAFLNGPFKYFSGLYRKLKALTASEHKHCPSAFFNGLNELEYQAMLVLSACKVDDPEETQKIEIVTYQIDRLFTLLQLQGAYDSNAFAMRLFEISKEIRERPAQELTTIFQTHLLKELNERRKSEFTESLNYPFFKNASVDRLNPRFIRYFFARVDELMARGMKQQMRHNVSTLVTSKGAKTGFHVEHILARNETNYGLFDGDKDRFEQERNRLGGVLLLKGRDNQSSGNESYQSKLATYANSLYWNETLREDTYQSKLDFKDFLEKEGLDIKPLATFGPDDVEQRQKLLFEISKRIWVAAPEHSHPGKTHAAAMS